MDGMIGSPILLPKHHLIAAPRFSVSFQTNRYFATHVIMFLIPEGDSFIITSHQSHGAKVGKRHIKILTPDISGVECVME